MPSRTLKLLVLASLVLGLPPGCCLLALPFAWAGEKAPAKGTSGCCDRCHRKDRQNPSPKPPRPIPASLCCCDKLAWLKPAPRAAIDTDTPVPAYLAPLACVPPGTIRRADIDLAIPGPSPPLHILKCVWLC